MIRISGFGLLGLKSLARHVVLGLTLGMVGSTAVAEDAIGINFVGGSSPGNSGYSGGGPVSIMQPAEVAGVLPQAFWNNAGIDGQSNDSVNDSGTLAAGSLKDSTGATVPNLTVSWNSVNTFSTLSPDTPGNWRLMKGYLDTRGVSSPYESSAATVTVTDLPDSYAQDGYSVVVYFDGLVTVGGLNRVGRYRVFEGLDNTGAMLGEVFARDNADFAGTFVRSTGTNSSDATAGNYLEFSDLHATTFTIDALGLANSVPRAPVNAIQIVPNTTVPEPSTIILLLTGAFGLLVCQRRKRR